MIARLLTAAGLTVAATLTLSSPSDAGLVISAPTVIATAGDTGSFNIVLTNVPDGTGLSYNVSSDVVQITLASIAGVTFTGATSDTNTTSSALANTAPYIFTSTPSGTDVSIAVSPTQLTAADSSFSTPSYQPVDPGQTFGLIHVTFAVDPMAALGSGSIVISTENNGSSLANNNDAAIDFSTTDGSFTVVSATATATPEPSTLLTAGVGLACLTCLGLRRRARTGGEAMSGHAPAPAGPTAN